MNNVLFVCTGNICRSPTAEGVFRKLLLEKKIAVEFNVDSAGTHSYYVGRKPDERAKMEALLRGYDISNHVARQLENIDFLCFDLILAMDFKNIQYMKEICPNEYFYKVKLLTNFSNYYRNTEVPDPYYGNRNGFKLVIDYIEDACNGLIDYLNF
ncbi:protein-tyrosine phosphatase [Candidatus Kinetoplastibacterium blastocrithidii TCC012E]|uniref:protein-tyrosine-phosphatase n=1 Tax=Candidatus Kinetoplastidibacterium blastocrithidiae TCC012E TaxID=1208922 RepID=M1M050_9PROT|nr:low molecular weight protein-tyrosine-phosphatase [Candidatus Kinetoplastibacterium blastocrithidii]AFZ83562.1 protein-tyrosine phosphatase [Candidatus Kinetoplastibacterium blastocrithidii (ex Strigomonas culicis)]AGF49681.1 protein-tyrosine phosphatase [Candidatus Kinetoplastibacterium blastocrithidii TCC012E]